MFNESKGGGLMSSDFMVSEEIQQKEVHIGAAFTEASFR